MKTVELFSMINKTSGKKVRERMTREGVDGQINMLSRFLGEDASDHFIVQSEGFFTARRVAYQCNSMSQADIDAGGDSDPYTIYGTEYTTV